MGSCCITQGAQFVTLWQPRGMGGRLRREGTYIYLWLIHVVMWQRPIQYHKAIILQLNINFKISGRILRKAIAQIISSVCLWMLHIAPDLCSGGSLYLECTTFSACQIPQFSSVQSLSCVQLCATPWIAARQASLSITNSQSSPKLMSIKSVMPSSHPILCCPLLLLPPIPPSIRVFSNESTLLMRWPKYWSFSLSISPSNEHPGLIYLSLKTQSKYLIFCKAFQIFLQAK